MIFQLNDDAMCPKCGTFSDAPRIAWRPDGYDALGTHQPEAICVSCPTCGYYVAVPCADAPAPPVIPPE